MSKIIFISFAIALFFNEVFSSLTDDQVELLKTHFSSKWEILVHHNDLGLSNVNRIIIDFRKNIWSIERDDEEGGPFAIDYPFLELKINQEGILKIGIGGAVAIGPHVSELRVLYFSLKNTFVADGYLPDKYEVENADIEHNRINYVPYKDNNLRIKMCKLFDTEDPA